MGGRGEGDPWELTQAPTQDRLRALDGGPKESKDPLVHPLAFPCFPCGQWQEGFIPGVGLCQGAALGPRPELCRAPRPDTHIFHLFPRALEPGLSNPDVASSAYSHSSLASAPSLKATATHLASPG